MSLCRVQGVLSPAAAHDNEQQLVLWVGGQGEEEEEEERKSLCQKRLRTDVERARSDPPPVVRRRRVETSRSARVQQLLRGEHDTARTRDRGGVRSRLPPVDDQTVGVDVEPDHSSLCERTQRGDVWSVPGDDTSREELRKKHTQQERGVCGHSFRFGQTFSGMHTVRECRSLCSLYHLRSGQNVVASVPELRVVLYG